MTATASWPDAVSAPADGACCRVLLARGELLRLIAVAHRARPREACGLLGGRIEGGDVRLRIYPAANDARSRSAFVMRSARIVALHRQIAADGWSPCGHYHSHPRGAARPSPVDRRFATAAAWWLIYSPPLRSLRAFWWDGGRFVARPICVA